VAPARHRFTAKDYHRMVAACILSEEARVELIDGEVVEMSPVGAKHVNGVNSLDRILHTLVGPDIEISIQNPVRLRFDTEPEPDVVLLAADRDRQSIPQVRDVRLLIEVSDSSLAYVRGTKLPLYARSGVAEAWIVDVDGETIERHTEPMDGRYRLVARAGRGESLPSTTVPAVTLDVNAVLG